MSTQWWQDLSEADQGELKGMWDRRAERLGWNRSSGDFEAVPVRLHGEVRDNADIEDAEYISTQLLEFVLNHEDIVFFLEERTFHICRRHPLAHAILRQGYIAEGFRCDKAGAHCPFAQISSAAGGKRVSFRLQVLRAGDEGDFRK